MKEFGVTFTIDPNDNGYCYEVIDAESEDDARCILLSVLGPCTSISSIELVD
jgi:hypothetical protein